MHIWRTVSRCVYDAHIGINAFCATWIALLSGGISHAASYILSKIDDVYYNFFFLYTHTATSNIHPHSHKARNETIYYQIYSANFHCHSGRQYGPYESKLIGKLKRLACQLHTEVIDYILASCKKLNVSTSPADTGSPNNGRITVCCVLPRGENQRRRKRRVTIFGKLKHFFG